MCVCLIRSIFLNINTNIINSISEVINFSQTNGIIINFLLIYIFTVVFSYFFIRYLSIYSFFILNTTALILFYVSLLPFFLFFFKNDSYFYVNFGDWVFIGSYFKIKFTLYIDKISYSFILLTTSIALFVNVYSYFYFRFDQLIEKFIFYINLFVISMVLLVSSGNFIVLFLGWELIGITSFILINFWVNRQSTLKSAFKAMFFNKVSDVLILFCIVLIIFFMQDLDIQSFNNSIVNYYNVYVRLLNFNVRLVELLSALLLTAAFIKSAQIGWHIWLPDSMEAPVPASALIHSATLVSAGVFLILRLYPLFKLSYYYNIIAPLVGSITAFYGGFVAIYQTDVKKILAYSTVSHCGFLVLLTTLGDLDNTILYLYVHGFFKALVFLCIGNVIRFFNNTQDFRKMGSASNYLEFELVIVFVCLINLSGLPNTLGYIIKHNILFSLNAYNYALFYFICFNVILGSIFGLIYSYLLFYNIFFDIKKNKKYIYNLNFSNKNFNLKNYDNSKAELITLTSLLIISYIIPTSMYIIFNWNFKLGNTFINEILVLDSSLGDNAYLIQTYYINYMYAFIIFIIIFLNLRSKEYSYLGLIKSILFIVFYIIFIKLI